MNKILVINEMLHYGGAEIYFNNLINILSSKGFEVKGLVLNKKNYNSSEQISLIDCSGKLNKICYNFKLSKKIKKIIIDFKPDIIILNNVFSGYLSVYHALKQFNVIQVVHDCKIFCPKYSADYLYKNKKCSGENCLKCTRCEGIKNVPQMFFRYLLMKRTLSLRKKYTFVSPSEILNENLIKRRYDSVCINNPIHKFSFAKCLNFNEKKFQFTYVGLICEEKGIFNFIKTCNEMENFNMIIIGGCKTNKDANILSQLISENKHIKWLKKQTHEETLKYISLSKFLVVPSKWFENYPTVILEAMSLKTFVIGSDRGGIPNMLSNNKGLVFEYDNKTQILEIVKKATEITEEEYNETVNNAFQYVNNNNNIDVFFERFNRLMIEVLDNYAR